MKKVIVTANPKNGQVFTKSLNPDGTAKLDKNGKEYGFIRVEQSEVSLGFAYNRGGMKKRSALISMTTEAWGKSPIAAGTEAPGAIVRHNSLKPFYNGQKALQTAEGKAITANGLPVYRNEFYTELKNLIEQGDVNVDFEAFDVAEKAPVKATVVAH